MELFQYCLLVRTPIIQNENTKIESGQIVNVLVKLGPDDSDIALNNGIGVLLNVAIINL